MIVAANISKNTSSINEDAAKDYETSFGLLYDFVDLFVINISCTNVVGLTSLQNISFLSPSPSGQWGSGVVGDLSAPLSDDALASVVKERFAVEALRCSQTQGREIKRVAVCGGSGAFLMKDAFKTYFV